MPEKLNANQWKILFIIFAIVMFRIFYWTATCKIGGEEPETEIEIVPETKVVVEIPVDIPPQPEVETKYNHKWVTLYIDQDVDAQSVVNDSYDVITAIVTLVDGQANVEWLVKAENINSAKIDSIKDIQYKESLKSWVDLIEKLARLPDERPDSK